MKTWRAFLASVLALAVATLYGKGTGKQKLSGKKLKDLKEAIQQIQPFKNKTPSEIQTLWKACLKAVAASCKTLRIKDKTEAVKN